MRSIAVFVLVSCTSMAALAQRDPVTYPYAGAPKYCYWLTAEQCDRAKAMVATGKKPAWCEGAWGVVGSGLSDEQQRVCWHYQHVESDKREEKREVQRRQSIEDARSAIRAGWARYRNLITSIELGYKCEVVDQTSANVAVMRVQATMQDEVNHAGLIGDPALNIAAFTDAAVKDGLRQANAGACTQLTPEWRGQVRSAVRSLMR